MFNCGLLLVMSGKLYERDMRMESFHVKDFSPIIHLAIFLHAQCYKAKTIDLLTIKFRMSKRDPS